MRTTIILLTLVTSLSAAQTPAIQNGQVETRRGTVAAEVSAAAPSRDPVWLAWRVPMVAGDRDLCSNWVTDRERVRGTVLEGPRDTPTRPTQAPPPASVNLDAGTNLIVLLRIMDGRLERIRTIADDCPIDANGQTLRWLNTVTPADSLAYLESLATDRSLGPTPQNIYDNAISAIALHRDLGANAILDRLTAMPSPSSIRTTAARWLANTRGDHGFDKVTSLIRDERDAKARANLVTALARSSSSRTPAALLTLARTDTDPNVRGEAATGYARTGAPNAVDTLLDLLAKEATEDTRARIVTSLDQVPGQAGLPALLNLARPESEPRLRKEAVRALSRSTDPRATAYLEGLLK